MAKHAKVLRVGIEHPVQSWDPGQTQDAASELVHAQVYESPFSQVVLGQSPMPTLFAGPLELQHGRAAVVHRGIVRRGRSFSDGTAVTPDHIVRSLVRTPLFSNVDMTVEQDTVLFAADKPLPLLERILSRFDCAISTANGGQFHGTGAFMRSSESTRDRVLLVRNPHYFRTVAIDAIEFAVYDGDHQERLHTDLEAGRIHLTMSLDAARTLALVDVHTSVRPGHSTSLLYFNTQREGLHDAKVRRTLAAAIDRFRLARIAYPHTAGLTARGVLPPSLDPHRDAGPWSNDRGQASAPALPTRLSMLVVWAPRPYNPAPRRLAEAIAKDLAAVGVDIELQLAASYEAYVASLRSGDYDLVLGGWIAESEDPGEFYQALVSKTAIPSPRGVLNGAGNNARWTDDEVDALLLRYASDGDTAALDGIAERVATEVPFLPLMHGLSVVAHSSRLRGFLATGARVPSLATVDLD